jgi:hypothetical protein
MIIVIKTIFSEICHVDIRPAAVVVITDGNPKSPALVGDPRPFGNFGECAVMVVVK